MSYQQCLKEIDSLHGLGVHCSLDLMREACAILNHPELKVPSVQIVGTNGKGSTASFLSAILTSEGLKAGLTISPHIISIRERIQIGGTFISEQELEHWHNYLKEKVGHLRLSYYEWMMLMTFLHFAEVKVDLAILEAGMGGRWDATSVAKPLIGAITNVSLDHQAILGNTLPEILSEKMQIIKPGMTAVTGISDPSLLSQLRGHCESVGVPLQVVSAEECQSLKPGLTGAHQKKNAGLAVAVVRQLVERGFPVPEFAIQSGITKATWPGRLEVVSERPAVLLDGGHNPAGIQTIVDYLTQSQKRVHLVFTTLNDRPSAQMLEMLLPFSDSVTIAQMEEHRALSPKQLQELRALCSPPGNILEITPEKWHPFASAVPEDQTILVTGSLYLVSKVRALIKGETS